MALAKRSHRFFKFRTLLVIRQPQLLFSNLFWFNLQYFSKYFLAHITNIPLYPLQGHSTFPRKYPYLFPFFFFPLSLLTFILLSNLTYFSFLPLSFHQMFAENYDFSRVVVGMAWIMLCIDYSRLFWLLFGVFSYENHEGKPRI